MRDRTNWKLGDLCEGYSTLPKLRKEEKQTEREESKFWE
jgi:hypothetical protein